MTTLETLIASATEAAKSSVSVKVGPSDSRCRHWAKVVRAGSPLPLPVEVDGATTIPGHYAKNGEDELMAGDFLIEGEEKHHRKARGWGYTVAFMSPVSGKLTYVSPSSEAKAAMKANGLPPNLLPGSGDLAACVRLAHAVRLGIAYE